MNNSDIMFSIKPKYLKLIVKGKKLYEYRNHFWDVEYPSWFTIYESGPISKIKYLLLLGKPFKIGEKLPITSYDTDKFNTGKTDRKYAYPILKILKINEPIDLQTMRKLNVTPPQDFIYVSRKPMLKRILEND